MTSFYPLFFIPQYQYRMWGGEKLKSFLGRTYEGQNKGESWEVSALKGFESKVTSGLYKGKTLPQLIKEYPETVLGKKVHEKFGTTFPLLIKFIDAKSPLSVQVHPNDFLAKKRLNSYGKNEMWYVLDAEPEAELIIGFKKEVDVNTFNQLLDENRLEEILHKEKVSSGDVVYIPTGRVHAIGGGVTLAEIQQSSDVTYRVYDYNRVDSKTGKTRQLHTELALDALNFSIQEEIKTSYSKVLNHVNPLIKTPYFTTNFVSIDGALERRYNANESFRILMCVKGNLEIIFDEKKYSFPLGQTVFIPAVIERIEIKGQGAYLEVSL